MTTGQNTTQLPAYLSIIVTFLVAVWFIGQLSVTQNPAGLAAAATSSLLTIQLICGWIFMPWSWQVAHSGLKTNTSTLLAAGTFIVTPWPLILICSQMFEIDLVTLIATELMILCAPILHSVLRSAICTSSLPRPTSDFGSLMLQWLPVLIAWPFLVNFNSWLSQ